MSDARGYPIQFVTPMPPARTGIAQYSADLLTAIGDHWPVTVVREREDGPRRGSLLKRGRRRPLLDPSLPTVLQLGNSGFHPWAFETAENIAGVLVLHDIVVHHGRLGEFVRRRGGADYRRLMAKRYGDIGAALAEQVLRGHVPAQLSDFPLFEDFVERARLTIVHSEYARQRVLDRVPSADVQVVPMGVPLPASVEVGEARRALGIPEQAFVAASVTHVNPYKRLDAVVRALRRVIDVVPEALLVVAGSVAPSVNLEHLVDLYGVADRVMMLGYVSDTEARLVARAADVCVNLRHPSTGETSASLLRLLGAGKPVLITDDESMQEYPRDAVLRIPVDAFEDEMIAEVLVLLADRPALRTSVGDAAREFVEREHSMDIAVEGYRQALGRAFGIQLPEVRSGNAHEPAPEFQSNVSQCAPPLSWLEREVVAALADSGIGASNVTIEAATRAIRDLRLDMAPVVESGGSTMSQTHAIRQELLDILACPVCKTPVRLDGERLVCDNCNRRYRIDDGIPVMLPEEAE